MLSIYIVLIAFEVSVVEQVLVVSVEPETIAQVRAPPSFLINSLSNVNNT